MSKGVYSLAERKSRGAIFCGASLTEQSHKDSCDINKIMATYEKSGVVPVMVNQVPSYSDFSQVHDYQTALNMIIEAENAFMTLPAKIRLEFDHDPAKFLAALEDPNQKARLIELGVVEEPLKNKIDPSGKGQSSSASGASKVASGDLQA